MSGIVGILHLDRSPIDRGLLERLTHFQSFRGPDALAIWIDGHVGFGHTLLKTTEESERDRQPFTLDGSVWIVADGRVDGQRDLVAKLRDHGQEILSGTTDVELILRAYYVWGEDCVQQLLGDFAFGIWDGPRQRLFCARDHMGVKPFYFAHIGSLVVFSNTLDCIRQHPAVSDRLNDLAIADFLLFEWNRDPARTTFAEIQRLPPAHRAVWSCNGFHTGRYWTLPIDEPLFLRRADDYIDRFKELLREAVGDRLRTNTIGVLMSGGLDSPALAATALDLLRKRYTSFDLRAFTKIDAANVEERYYAGLVASHLEIPIRYLDHSQKTVDPNWESMPFHTPEPKNHPWELMALQSDFRPRNSYSRVFFYGEGPDNTLSLEWGPYVSYLARKHRYGRLLKALFATVLSHRKPPFWGRISRKVRQSRPEVQLASLFPTWLDATFESRLQLRARFTEFRNAAPSRHPLRPEAYDLLHSPLWQDMFEALDAGSNIVPFEVRQPFLDLRVIRFLLAVPALPWCRRKYLLRRAMRGALPVPVLRRTKASAPLIALTDTARSGVRPMVPVAGVERYIDPRCFPKSACEDAPTFAVALRARSLNFWLHNSRFIRDNAERLQPTEEDLPNERTRHQVGRIRDKETI